MNELAAEKCIMVRKGVNAEVACVQVSQSLINSDSTLESLERRGCRVVIDCGRGPEIAESLGVTKLKVAATGVLVRLAGVEDELVSRQLTEIASKAMFKCSSWLEDADLCEVLLHIEPLLDGQTVYFHFLEKPGESFQDQLGELLSIYESELSSSAFVKKVATGCGPGCGTSDRSGAGCGSSCSGCAIRCAVSPSTAAS